MRIFLRSLLVLLLIPTLGYAVENPLLGYTHMLPSPFTLPAGRVIIGSTTGVGITDSIGIETNVLADLYQIYNATARVSLLDFPGMAFGFNLGYQYVNFSNISSNNPDLAVSSWLPGAVLGLEVFPDIALFLGGKLFFPNTSVSNLGIDASGLLQGTEFESDISWAYNPKSNLVGNVLAAGVSYNTTFNFYGVGVSHYWKGLHLGLHYYPNASNFKVRPILSGSLTIEL